jgi:predicted DCC family thiol-disulfide oxidoreductase YuxK
MTSLTVLYDAGCGFCVRCRRWLESQQQLVPLTFVPAGSLEARTLFPSLYGADAEEELIAVDDQGGVYEGTDAWLICLYALAEYREWSFRLAQPALRPLARVAFEWLSRNRRALSQQLHLAPEDQLVATWAPLSPTACPPRAGAASCEIPRRER